MSDHREIGETFGSIRQQIKRALTKYQRVTQVPTHRDFSPEHLIAEEDCLVGLDFDEFCQYDPLFDVAHFVAHLRFLALTSFGSLDHLSCYEACFREAYASGSANFQQARLRLLMAVAFLKLTYLEAIVRRMKSGKSVLLKLLQTASELAS